MQEINIIRKPVITEKAAQMEADKIYTFWVNPKANKISLKKAFEKLYGAKVTSVNIVKVPGKIRKLRKGNLNKRNESLKAHFHLEQSIDVNKFASTDKAKKVKAEPKKTTKIKA